MKSGTRGDLRWGFVLLNILVSLDLIKYKHTANKKVVETNEESFTDGEIQAWRPAGGWTENVEVVNMLTHSPRALYHVDGSKKPSVRPILQHLYATIQLNINQNSDTARPSRPRVFLTVSKNSLTN